MFWAIYFYACKNFEQALINLVYDDIFDGKLLTANINSDDSLTLEVKNISDLIGIYFKLTSC